MVFQNKTQNKNNNIKIPNHQPQNYVVVFDLDETLGHFEQLSIFWDCLKHYFDHTLNKQDLFNMFDLFLGF